MKAAICTAYGPPEVLKLMTVAQPEPKEFDLLIRVYASAVQSGDRRIRALDVPPAGRLPMRIALGFKAPRKPVLGVVVAGEVAAVGSRVQHFKVGDRVYGLTGMRLGGYAEYACIHAHKCIHLMPLNASFNEAASLPFGGTTALHFLRKAQIEQANSVLIYGASGAVGSAAVQIAKYYNTHVTAVCSDRHAAMVRDFGADEVIDYHMDDYDNQLSTYDAVFDASGKINKLSARKHVERNGQFCSVAGQGVAKELREDLTLLNQMFEAGHFKAVIDRVYPLEEIVEAHRYVDSGRKYGNVIVQVVEE
ncbi:NAD(P)-dependent alcohol dehydrogenase [Jeotgalibacillus haloalkalitolerans]|uniref:NAD(P)-dependent alcohol dehydrogenase n=1 Tax=Jeotgalibacillus haloalkalitolerans TaxID=3104292 RepID=A0ABU5KND3_9BACL|nr:NAD(P)-dependent alcohol dehydrogenase [Jeotgalibacillus sp. HH7-29]MDZ5712773.1 NAD(P)-dependent alcohol dehydrogenase [Jeotgalibacillus sp. HH7-29]